MATYLLAIMLAGGVAAENPSTHSAAAKSTVQMYELPPPALSLELQVEASARSFRIRTYQTFRNDRAEFNRRESAGFNAEQAWIDAGRNPDDAPRLTEWFRKAEDCSRTGSIAALPVAPKFIAFVPKKAADAKIAKSPAGGKPDDRLQVKTAGSTTKPATGSAEQLLNKPEAVSAKSLPPAVNSPVPPTIASPNASSGNASTNSASSTARKPSVISSLPAAFGAKISGAIDSLSSK